MAKYLVVDPLQHDGKSYEPDEKIELSKEAAAPLLALGTISDGKAKQEEEANTQDETGSGE